MKTSVPIVDRQTIYSGSPAISGVISDDEPAGTVLYVYLNTRRVGTTTISAAIRNIPRADRPAEIVQSFSSFKTWTILINNLSFGIRTKGLRKGDKIYFRARAFGKEISDITRIYTVDGIDQPDAAYVRDDQSKPKQPVYERDRYIQGDVPLLNDVTLFRAEPNIAEGVSVSVYINGTYLTTTQTDQNGHWILDTWDSSDPNLDESPLLPLAKNDVITTRAFRYKVIDDQRIEIVAPSAESVPTEVLSGFFRTRMYQFLPATIQADDKSGDLKSFINILALTYDEIRTYIDQFTDIFNLDRCDPKYFDPISRLLGYPLNKLDSIESQRFQLKNAVEFWRRKGTISIFKILFYMLDYNIEVRELWTDDYVTFYPTIMNATYTQFLYTDGQGNPTNPPDTAPELLENGGTWYRSPYFGIILRPLTAYVDTPPYPYQTDAANCPLESNNLSISLSTDDLKYLLERIDYFRPAHTVLDYISFQIDFVECGPIPYEETEIDIEWHNDETGWYPPYCEPDDPIYYRDGLRSTRPDGKGTIALGVTRNPAGLVTSTMIKLKRLALRGYCHPGEELTLDPLHNEDEDFYSILPRSGMGIGFYPDGSPIPSVHDMNDWPSRNPICDPPDRSGKYRYISRLQVITAIAAVDGDATISGSGSIVGATLTSGTPISATLTGTGTI